MTKRITPPCGASYFAKWFVAISKSGAPACNMKEEGKGKGKEGEEGEKREKEGRRKAEEGERRGKKGKEGERRGKKGKEGERREKKKGKEGKRRRSKKFIWQIAVNFIKKRCSPSLPGLCKIGVKFL
eukprot:Phypoly_transcript_20902.p2 GENE.Phypoly_transcript_20902~~Phypoly_transcript_20902.p2  ORF type:complete len:127 (-),score=43.22 Phypoly_transcript_20902:167-547(-)